MTKETGYTFFVCSTWTERVETPATIGAKFVDTLDALTSIDPIFANWEVFDHRHRSSLPLSAARSRIARIFETNVVRSDFGNPEPENGYSASAMAGEFRDPRSVLFIAHAGGRFGNRIDLKFGGYDVLPDLTIVTYPLFRKALLAVNAIWRTPWVCAEAFRSGTVAVPMNFEGVEASKIESLRQVPGDPTFPSSIFHIPWIASLSEELVAGMTPSRQILTERMPDGNLLMTVTSERLDPTNPEHARRARILAEILIAQVANHSFGVGKQ
jgi:hypothetical protein